MLNLTADAKEAIKAGVDLAKIIQSEGHVLSPNGPKWRGVCPFEEGSTNTSKFVASDDFYKCWACDAKGDVFTWFQEKHGMTWSEAVEHVAELGKFDLEPYRGKRKPETAQERAQRRAGDALVAIAELSFETAMGLDAAERCIDGMDVTSLIAGRELGLLPESRVIDARLEALGIDAATRRAAGITEAGGQFSRRWVFWAWKKKQVSAGRLYGRPGPVVGSMGSDSRGWTAPAHIEMGEKNQGAILAWDDKMYISLRLQGVSNVARAVSRASISDTRGLRMDNIESPPILAIRPTKEARSEAWEHWAQPLLGVNPRLRVGEYRDDVPDALELLKSESGTVFDWQIKLASEEDIFSDPGKVEFFRARLNKGLERMNAGSVEGVVYRTVVDNIKPSDVTKSAQRSK